MHNLHPSFRPFLLAAFLLSFAQITPLSGQQPPARLPDLQLSKGGKVHAVVTLADGQIIIGGEFQAVNGVLRHNLARLNINGTVDLFWDPNVNGVQGGSVLALALDGTNLFVGGLFDTVGFSARTNLAKVSLEAPGLPDPLWAPNPVYLNVDNEGESEGEPRTALVRTILVHGPDVFVGGSFNRIGGVFRSLVAKVGRDGAGAVDAEWFVNIFGDSVWDLAVNEQELRSDFPGNISPPDTNDFNRVTNIIIGGRFELSYREEFSTENLIRASAVGTAPVDTSWQPIPNGAVHALLISDGHLFVGGAFTDISDVHRARLAKIRLEDFGGADFFWRANLDDDVELVTDAVSVDALAESGGLLYVGGRFTNVHESFERTVSRPHLFRTPVSGTNRVDRAWSPTPDQPVRALATGGKLVLAGGDFEHAGGSISLGFVKLDALTGARDRSPFVHTQVPGLARTIARQPDGKVIVGGAFDYAGGLPRRNIARVNADGTLDVNWAPDANGEVLTLATVGTDVFVGGQFNQIGRQTRYGLAKLSATGTDVADPLWAPAAPDSVIYVITIDANTNVYVGGRFTVMADQFRTNLARLSPTNTGQADPFWAPNPTRGLRHPQTGLVMAIATTESHVFVGGDFRRVAGLPRTNLVKLDLVSGEVDPAWMPNPSPIAEIMSIALAGTNIFVGGRFTGIDGVSGRDLARLSTLGSGQVDPRWNPSPRYGGRFVQIESLVLSGTNLYVAGLFHTIGGEARSSLARIDAFGSGVADPLWDAQLTLAPASLSETSDDPTAHALVLKGADIYVAGHFTGIGGATRFGFALLPMVEAPVMIRTGSNALVIARNPADGDEVTHFRITSIRDGQLFLSNGVTPVAVNDFVPASVGAAGLVFIASGPNGSVAAVSAVGPRPEDAGSLAATLDFNAAQPPVFSMSSANYFVDEGGFSVMVTVEKRGVGAGSVMYAVEEGTAMLHVVGCGIGDYVVLPGDTLTFGANETSKSIPIFIIDDTLEEGDETFTFRLLNPSAGTRLAGPAQATVTILDDEKIGSIVSNTNRVRPGPPPPASGALVVRLQPLIANGQWRLQGETEWRTNGATLGGLATGPYILEFRPVALFGEPAPQAVFIESGFTTVIEATYSGGQPSATGDITVLIKPDSLAIAALEANRGQWRLLGQSNWLNSGGVLTGVSAGFHILEFKPVPGWAAPPNRTVVVSAGLHEITGLYLVSGTVSGFTPHPVPFTSVTNDEPYLYNGEVETEFGFGSGVVVKRRVVLTAAHVIFDDLSLGNATEMKWHFQRHKGDLEPVPLLARGAFSLRGYAAQRTNDINSGVTPGESTPESQDRDAAALYFVEAGTNPNLPGRGGFGGYLSSDNDQNEWLESPRLKMLVGYPLSMVNITDAGRMHATTPTNAVFRRLNERVYETTDLISFPGHSGGPVYVQHDDGQYYPAAIYLGGTAQSIVRAIDCYVVDLINRAESAASGGGNNTSGGVTLWQSGTSGSSSLFGLFRVQFQPGEAMPVAGWRVAGAADPTYINDARLYYPSEAASLWLEFRPVLGYGTPTNQFVEVEPNQTKIVSANYAPFRFIEARRLSNGDFEATVTGVTGRLYTLQVSMDLTNWASLRNFTNTTGAVRFTEPAAAAGSQRFYRAREL